MESHIFTAVVEVDEFEDGRPAFQAYCPALPGCQTWGETQEQALERLREAVELWIEDRKAAGEELPRDPRRGAIYLPSPAVLVTR